MKKTKMGRPKKYLTAEDKKAARKGQWGVRGKKRAEEFTYVYVRKTLAKRVREETGEPLQTVVNNLLQKIFGEESIS